MFFFFLLEKQLKRNQVCKLSQEHCVKGKTKDLRDLKEQDDQQRKDILWSILSCYPSCSLLLRMGERKPFSHSCYSRKNTRREIRFSRLPFPFLWANSRAKGRDIHTNRLFRPQVILLLFFLMFVLCCCSTGLSSPPDVIRVELDLPFFFHTLLKLNCKLMLMNNSFHLLLFFLRFSFCSRIDFLVSWRRSHEKHRRLNNKESSQVFLSVLYCIRKHCLTGQDVDLLFHSPSIRLEWNLEEASIRE